MVVVEIGLISPPVGMNLFVLNALLPQVPTKVLFQGVLPFVVADVVRLGILVAFPIISLWLRSKRVAGDLVAAVDRMATSQATIRGLLDDLPLVKREGGEGGNAVARPDGVELARQLAADELGILGQVADQRDAVLRCHVVPLCLTAALRRRALPYRGARPRRRADG